MFGYHESALPWEVLITSLYLWNELKSFNEADRSPTLWMTTEAHKFLQLLGGEFAGWVMGPQWNWERYAYPNSKGLSQVAECKESACQYRGTRWGQALGCKDPLRGGIATTPVILPETSHRQRSDGHSPWGWKNSFRLAIEHSTAHTSKGGSHLRKHAKSSCDSEFSCEVVPWGFYRLFHYYFLLIFICYDFFFDVDHS